MAYIARTAQGGQVAMARNMRILSINGEPTEFYVSGIRPKAASLPNPFLRAWPVVLEATSLVDGAVVGGTDVTLRGQVRFEEDEEVDPNRGPNDPVTKGYFFVHTYDQRSSTQRLLKVTFADAPDGQMYADAYTVELVTQIWEVTPEDEDRGRPGTLTGTNVVLIPYVRLKQKQQLASDGVDATLIGDALLVVSKSDVSLADVTSATFIRITPSGAEAVNYTVANRDLLDPGNHQHEIQLQRVKQ